MVQRKKKTVFTPNGADSQVTYLEKFWRKHGKTDATGKVTAYNP